MCVCGGGGGEAFCSGTVKVKPGRLLTYYYRALTLTAMLRRKHHANPPHGALRLSVYTHAYDVQVLPQIPLPYHQFIIKRRSRKNSICHPTYLPTYACMHACRWCACRHVLCARMHVLYACIHAVCACLYLVHVVWSCRHLVCACCMHACMRCIHAWMLYVHACIWCVHECIWFVYALHPASW